LAAKSNSLAWTNKTGAGAGCYLGDFNRPTPEHHMSLSRRLFDHQSIMPCDCFYNAHFLQFNLRQQLCLHAGLRQLSSYAVTLAIRRWHAIERYCS
jgi:hypothetical protein